MNIAVFTSNQARHHNLISSVAEIADTVYAIQEVGTLFPGRVQDFYQRSTVMENYFEKVVEAEIAEFGTPGFNPENVRSFPMKSGDLNMVETRLLAEALTADVILVFGASYIRDPLIHELVDRKAINIHMGVSPYYRGTACNFWALYDDKPEYVGATIHLLSEGLDSGPMLFHALPSVNDGEAIDGFRLGMRAVKAAFDALIPVIQSGELDRLTTVKQDRSREIRYTRNRDFTDDVAAEYMKRPHSPESLTAKLAGRQQSDFINPRFVS